MFLVLAKKAGAIVPRELVGNWLYGVAYRTALQARARRNRRRARSRCSGSGGLQKIASFHVRLLPGSGELF